MLYVYRLVVRRGGLALGVALLIAAVVVPTIALGSQVPFTGTFTETFQASACPSPGDGLYCATSSGSGTASHLGKSTEAFLATVDFSQPDSAGCFPDTSTGTITAANGDQVFITAAGTFCQSSPTTGTDAGPYTVTGGTGRFTGATGGGTFTATLTFNATFTGGSSSEVYTGTISY